MGPTLEFYGLPTILPATDYSGPTLPYYYSQPASHPIHPRTPAYGMGPTLLLYPIRADYCLLFYCSPTIL